MRKQVAAQKHLKQNSPQQIKPSNVRWIGIGLGLSGIALLSATAGALLAISLASTPLMQTRLTAEEAAVFGKGDRISTGGTLQMPELTRPVNILILGTKVLTSDLDNPPDRLQHLGYHALVDSFEGLTDTMLLVRFDPTTRKLSALSIPRDTRSWIEDHGLQKINEANFYGGPALSAKAVSELLGGVGIDRYIRLNVQGIEKLIDALGGVSLYVPQDMEYRDDSQHLYINLKAGQQHLDGERAMQFVRFRYDDLGDIGRIQRQQLFIRALLEQALNPGTLARLPKLMSIIQSNLDTNLSVEELFALAGFATRTDRSKVQMLMVPGRFSSPEEFQASYWLPDYERIDTMMSQHFGVATAATAQVVKSLDPAYVNVAIQDSTGEWGAVDDLVNTLYDQGYGNVYVSQPWNEPLKVTRIVAQDGDVTVAKDLQRSLGFGEVRVESTGSLRSDITIQLGQDWLRQKHRMLSQPDHL
ncbi:MAG: LCP family protein [Desertifilum sp. SIO1I2]|nr:LCP family protein [Desertifilum sp. SIO1I2]